MADEYNEIPKSNFDYVPESQKYKKDDLLPVKSLDEKEKKILEDTLSEDFSSKDRDYLVTLFGDNTDYYNLSEKAKGMRESKLKSGYPICETLNTYIFISLAIIRLQIQYKLEGGSREILKNIEKLALTQVTLQKALDEIREKQRSGKDIQDLHNEELEDNAKFIQEHIGEFSFKCNGCGRILNSGGLPHWAIKSKLKSGEIHYHIWNQQVYYAYNKGIIPLHLMAFFLEVSPEGIEHTASERGVDLPKFDMLEEESKLEELLKDFEQ